MVWSTTHQFAALSNTSMEILPGFVRRGLQRASELRDHFYDQVEEAQDVVQDVTDFIVHSKVNKKVRLTPDHGQRQQL